MTASARVDSDGSVTIATPFNRALVDEFKTIPPAYREWNKTAKTWTFHEPYAVYALSAARRFYPGLRVINPGGASAGSPPPRSPSSWAEVMFNALPDHLHDPVFKALIRVVHPDIGGDHRAAQQLNDAHANRRRSA